MEKTIKAGNPITVKGDSRADVKRQMDELRVKAKAEGLSAIGGFIAYHQGLPGEPDVYDSVITFNKP